MTEIRLDWLNAAVAIAVEAEADRTLDDRQRRALASLSSRYFFESIGIGGGPQTEAAAPIGAHPGGRERR
jgi:hypothetical protein